MLFFQVCFYDIHHSYMCIHLFENCDFCRFMSRKIDKYTIVSFVCDTSTNKSVAFAFVFVFLCVSKTIKSKETNCISQLPDNVNSTNASNTYQGNELDAEHDVEIQQHYIKCPSMPITIDFKPINKSTILSPLNRLFRMCSQ